MLFTWSTKNLCIVFSGWRVTGTWSLVWSLIAVMVLSNPPSTRSTPSTHSNEIIQVLTAGYEAVREVARQYEAREAARLADLPSKSSTALPDPSAVLIPFKKTTTQSAAHSSLQGARPLLLRHRRKEGLLRRRSMGFRCFIRFL